MAFNSFAYLVFFILCFSICRHLAGSNRSYQWVLLIASIFFYGYWSPPFVLLLIFTVLSNYLMAPLMAGKNRRWLAMNLCLNLGLLFFFKYLSFFIYNLNQISGLSLPNPKIPLPVGISFFTFQAMSYSIDVFRGQMKDKPGLREVFLYISFFPQLVAGPIVRAREFLPQLKERPNFDVQQAYAGIFFIFLGLFQKCYLADLLGFYYVDHVFSHVSESNAAELILAFIAFPLQLFNDFSGYSHIAIGSARILGYKIPINFDSPYLTNSPSEFWGRWHISLSNWIRDYLFYPLLFSKWLKARPQICILITMTCIGLWHGAAWNFILFGVFHGILSLLYQRLPKIQSPRWATLHYPFFLFVIFIGMTLFRVESISDFPLFLKRMSIAWQSPGLLLDLLSPLFLLSIATHFLRAAKIEKLAIAYANSPWILKAALIILISISVVHADRINRAHMAFIYFQF